MPLPLIRIVDDDEAVRTGIAFVLEGEGWETRAWPSAESFLRENPQEVPGCLILDINMPGMNGLELQRVLRERGDALPIIFLTGQGSINLAVSTIKLGAVEFLEKTEDSAHLVRAVRDAVARSRTGFANGLPEPYEAIGRVRHLTERELEIARLLSSGLLNRQIAERLGISMRTVETHRQTLLRKLEVKTVSELATLLSMAELR